MADLTSVELVSGISNPLSLLELNSNILPMFALSILNINNAEGGIFSRITMTSMTSKWYLRLGHFEAILVGLIVLQIFVMRYFLILPLDVSKLMEDGTLLATSVSRKKRRASMLSIENNLDAILKKQHLAETMFTVIRRLDEDDCFIRTLCELEQDSSNRVKSEKITNLLTILKRLGLQRVKLESEMPSNNVTILERKVLSEFEDSVLLGSGYGSKMQMKIGICDKHSKNVCASYFSLCNLESSELLGYVVSMTPFI